MKGHTGHVTSLHNALQRIPITIRGGILLAYFSTIFIVLLVFLDYEKFVTYVVRVKERKTRDYTPTFVDIDTKVSGGCSVRLVERLWSRVSNDWSFETRDA